MRTCTTCLKGEGEVEFNSGSSSYCRTCQRAYAKAHYQANKEAYLARSKALKQELISYVWKLKEEGTCADCGINPHPAAMQWDHLPEFPKHRDISKLVYAGLKKQTILELEKCELVCANCHFIRTWTRNNDTKEIHMRTAI